MGSLLGESIKQPSFTPNSSPKYHSVSAASVAFNIKDKIMSKLITVFGATGNQGGSVIKHILADSTLSKTFKIRGITRDTSKPAAQVLAKQGVELKSVSSLNASYGLD